MKTVLIVDDSLSMRQTVSLAIKQMGHEAIEAVDGVDGLAKLADNRVSMVLSDVNMPRMGGIEFVRKARATPHGRLVPIMMLTTESDPGKKLEGKAAGATGWIVKPFTREQLATVVNKFLR